jgi:four helix bundle protein
MKNNKTDKGYHKLLIWQKARELVRLIYKFTENFPRSEEFGLKSQLRRAGVSVVLTIVEGYRRNSKKQFIYFLNVSTGSLAEIEAGSELSHDLNFLNTEVFEAIDIKRGEVAYLVDQFTKSLSK